jgi:two-component system response regulator YesN
MYKVLIVDDEPAIRAGLKTLIDWERYGFVVAGDAMNGREAISKHRELAPDVIIIDIRMPGMDGLQAIEEIRKTDPVCRFLILSGYADFDYAKRAISGRVDGYILKPVDESEIAAELERIHGYLQKQSELAGIAVQNAAAQREALIQSLLLDDAAKHADLLPEMEKLIGPSSGAYQVMLVECRLQQETDSRLIKSMKRQLANIFEESGRGYVFSAEPFLGVLLKDVIKDERKRAAVYDEIMTIAEKGIEVCAAAGKAVKHLADAGASFSEAVRLLKHRFLFGDELIIRNGPIAERDINGACGEQAALPDIDSLAEKLYYAVDMGNKEGLEHWLDRAGHEITAWDCSETSIKTNYAQLLSVVLNKLAGMNEKTYTIVQDYMPLIKEIYEERNYEALKQKVRNRLGELTGRISSAGNEPVLKQIIDFIERHYHENLKLETLAEVFNYTSGYLGKIFKNYTGCHFHTYLDQIRIQKAIGLLKEGMKVHQVAVRVGYANADYFHSKFKKYTGKSPSAYKVKKGV